MEICFYGWKSFLNLNKNSYLWRSGRDVECGDLLSQTAADTLLKTTFGSKEDRKTAEWREWCNRKQKITNKRAHQKSVQLYQRRWRTHIYTVPVKEYKNIIKTFVKVQSMQFTFKYWLLLRRYKISLISKTNQRLYI